MLRAAAVPQGCRRTPARHLRPESMPRPLDAHPVRDALLAELARAQGQSAFPGAWAAIGDRDGIVAEGTVGTLDWEGGGAPDAGTLWDVASLTKVVALTPLVMRLEADGALALDAPVRELLPEWTAGDRSEARVRDLLTHSAGLPAWHAYHRRTQDPAELRRLVLATPPEVPAGTRYVYSDVGALLLGFLAERVGGAPLDELVRRHVLTPLGMDDSGYRPDVDGGPPIAPTEVVPGFGRPLRGEVHDDNARALGGAAGHAGLFASGRSLARFASVWLHDGRLEGRQLLPAGSVARYSRRATPALSHRALGWETAAGAASAGRRLAPTAVGHTGFTGTSLWIDREQEIFVLLLSNRVCRSRQNRRILSVRPALTDAVVGALQAARTGAGAAVPSSTTAPT